MMKNAGMDTVVTKPVQIDSLILAIYENYAKVKLRNLETSPDLVQINQSDESESVTFMSRG